MRPGTPLSYGLDHMPGGDERFCSASTRFATPGISWGAMGVVTLDACEASPLVWRLGEQTFLTLVVKATFALEEPGVMPRIAPRPISFAETPRSDGKSLRYDVELVPYRPRTDVTLVGQIYAPPDQTLATCSARLTLERGAELLINKTIEAHADHTFVAMPIRWEDALGGPEGDNPVGSATPTLRIPGAPRSPAGFAPISAEWPSRARLRRAKPLVKQGAFEYAAGFDWNHMQGAPPDQQVRYLVGDETLRLDGLHPDHDNLEVQLPGARAVGAVFGLGLERQLCAFVADTLVIEPDERRVSVVWRTVLEVPDVATARAVEVAVGVAVSDAPVVLPERREDVAAFAGGSRPADLEGTVVMSSATPHPNADAPFSIAKGAGQASSFEALRAQVAPPALLDLEGTMAISSRRPPAHSAIDSMAAANQASSQPTERRAATPVPGSPWADQAPVVPAPSEGQARTLDPRDLPDFDAMLAAAPAKPAPAKPRKPPPRRPEPELIEAELVEEDAVSSPAPDAPAMPEPSGLHWGKPSEPAPEAAGVAKPSAPQLPTAPTDARSQLYASLGTAIKK